MTVDRILEDAEFGHLYLKSNARAVRYTFRPAHDGSPQCGILITVPRPFDEADVRRAVEQMRPQLRQMLAQLPHGGSRPAGPADATQPSHHIDWGFRIESESLHIHIVKGVGEGFFVKHQLCERDAAQQIVRPAEMQLICPPDCDFDAPGRQTWLEKVLAEGIRKHAKHQLLPMLVGFAAQYGIALHEVKVNSSKSHWGSCSRHVQHRLVGSETEYFNINLSLFTVLLPLSLQRFILLHELTHTRHMDHSPAFHRDLDAWLGGTEQELDRQLKRYSTNVFSFSQNTTDL